MKKYWSLIIGLVSLASVAVHAAPREPGLVARVHFAGGDAVAADPNSVPLKNVWSSPEAQALRLHTLDSLSHFLDGWVREAIAPNLASVLQTRPLLADLCQTEWQLEVRQPAGSAVEFSLAVRLDPARAQAWQAALTPVVAGWKQSSPGHHGYLIDKRDWLFFALDNAPAPSAAGAIASLNHAWLTAEVDWTRLAVWFPTLRKFDLPQTQLQVSANDGNFESTGRLFLAQPLPPVERWQFPTNLINSPLVSFTAARGISDWLRQESWATGMGINPLPNQMFAWVQPQIPFLTYFALPLANAPSALPKVAAEVRAVLQTGQPGSPYESYSVSTEDQKISLVGMPFVVPFLEARKEPSGDCLLGGFLEVAGRPQPIPAEIMARLNEPNLVYYHWENTAQRMQIFPQLYQLLFVISRHRQLDVVTPAGKWVAHLAPSLGSTFTLATEVSPTELSFYRRAPAGLTAVELVALGSWLDAPNFPGCDLRLPPPRKRHAHPPAAGTPAPTVQHP